MAALLCQSIGQLLSNCTLPCRSCCDGVSKVLCSPFFPYIALTVGLNLPPVLWGAKAITTDCDSSWLLVNALATGLNIVAAFYIVYKMQNTEEQATDPTEESMNVQTADAVPIEDNKPSVEEGNSYVNMAVPMLLGSKKVQMVSKFKSVTAEGPGEANSVQRLGKVMCYDAGVAIYIIIFCGWIVWQSIGISKVLFGGEQGDDEDTCSEVHQHMLASITCGFLYLMLVCFFFGCSLICLR